MCISVAIDFELLMKHYLKSIGWVDILCESWKKAVCDAGLVVALVQANVWCDVAQYIEAHLI